MTSPAVSAIIIFLNGERYLAEAIESVVAQTSGDWELLLCDDGSAAPASAIAKDYAARFPGRIVYLEHPNHENRGMSATRNLGLRHARGRYVAWLDADDVWVPEKLAEQVAVLEAHPQCAMVYGPLKLWYGWTGRPEDRGRDFAQDLGVPADSVVPPGELLIKFLRDDRHHPSGVLVRRDVLDAVGGYEAAFRGEYEDVIVQSKVTLEHPVYAAGRCWYWYRQHEGSCTAATRRNWEDRPVRLAYLNRLEQYLRQRGVTSGAVWDELQNQFKPYRRRWLYAATEFARRIAVRVKGSLKYVLPAAVMTWLRAQWWGLRHPPARPTAADRVQTGRAS